MSLDQRAPIPFLLPGKFGAMDFNNVLLTMDTLWTLIAALADLMGPESKVNDASLRLNMVVQRILWETSHRMGFLPAMPRHKTCSVCHVVASMEGIGTELVDLMVDWRCDKGIGILECLKAMANKVIHDPYTAYLVHAWIHYFNAVSERPIHRQPLTSKSFQHEATGRPLRFTPAKLTHEERKKTMYPPDAFHKICQVNDKPYKAFIPYTQPVDDLLLLIIINEAKFVDNIPLLEYLYGRHFNRILYCSDSMAKFEANYEKDHPANPVTYVTMPHKFHPEVCTSTAIQMNYDVIGYLQINDDLLFNLWNYHHVPLNQPWFQHFIGMGHIMDEFFRPGNGNHSHFESWWFFREKMRQAWGDLQRFKLNTDSPHQKLVSRFFQTLSESTDNCSTCIFFGNTDIFYLPNYIGKEFAILADFFTPYMIHFEVVIINIIGGLVPKDKIYRLKGMYTWDDDRNHYRKFYQHSFQFFHPWKLSLLENPKDASFFCEHYLHNLDVDLMESHNNR